MDQKSINRFIDDVLQKNREYKKELELKQAQWALENILTAEEQAQYLREHGEPKRAVEVRIFKMELQLKEREQNDQN